MPTYLHPGVYVEEVDSGARPIESVAGAVTAFVGPARRGPVGEAVLIHGLDDYEKHFGKPGSREEAGDETGSEAGADGEPDAMDLAVTAYYSNSGGAAYVARLASSAAAEAPAEADYRDFFQRRLSKVADVGIIVLPGQWIPASGTGNGAVDAAVAHCESMGDRMVIVDVEPGYELTDARRVEALALPTSSYAAVYYPWVEVRPPTPSGTSADPDDSSATLTPTAPSAFAAALWARTDARRGIWKAPAGVEAALLGIAGLEFDVGDGEQDQLNPLGVNALRRFPGLGTVIWGARTLATLSSPPWRYLPVRRTAIHLEESIRAGIQWAVFEPNDARLWASLRLEVEAFLEGLWRAGAFQGERSSDAYFVRCGLGDGMTQGDIDRGRVIVVVGFAPLKPAEFVIVRIQQQTGSH